MSNFLKGHYCEIAHVNFFSTALLKRKETVHFNESDLFSFFHYFIQTSLSNFQRQPFMIHHRITYSEEETFLLGQEIAKEILREKNIVIALTGDLGAGKTTLTKGIIHGLVQIPIEEITSPTFQYASLFTSHDEKIRVSHLDLWRLTSHEEFLDLGLGELLHTEYCIVEWPDRIKKLILPSTKTINAHFIDMTKREYSYFHSFAETCT